MSAINPQQHTQQLTVKQEPPRQKKSTSERQSSTSTAKSQSTDKYDTSTTPSGGLYEGAVRFGEILHNPTLTRMDRKHTVVMEEKEISGSVKTDGMDAQFSASLKKEAFTFSELERRMHDLLGFTCEAYQTSLTASGQLTASETLEDGTFFSSSFAAFASAASITYQYTFNNNFASHYDKAPQETVEYNFSSLKALMEAVVIKQNPGEKATYFFNGK